MVGAEGLSKEVKAEMKKIDEKPTNIEDIDLDADGEVDISEEIVTGRSVSKRKSKRGT